MTLKSPFALLALWIVASCGGAQEAAPASAADEAAAESSASADDETVPAGPSGDAAEEPSPGEGTEALIGETASEGDDATAKTADVGGDEAEAASEEEPPSDDLQSYVGTGAYTPEYRTVTDNMDAVKQCYLDGLRVDPDISGTIKMRFTVNKAGKAIKIKAVLNELNDQVEQCIVGTLKKIKFPKRKTNRMVEYPFKFIPAP